MKYDRKKLGEVLVELGVLAPAAIDLILAKQVLAGKFFGITGIEEGLLTEEDLARGLAHQFACAYVDLEQEQIDPRLMDELPPGIPLKYDFVPLARTGTLLTVAVADPTNVEALDNLERLLGLSLDVRVAAAGQIRQMLQRGEGSHRVLRKASEDFKLQLVRETDRGEEILSIDKLTGDASPIIRLVDSTLYDALNKRASDIHIEGTGGGVVIKYRVDGVLFRATETIDSRLLGPIVSRIKVMSELDIAESRIPQDGRFKVRLEGRSIDFRVSIMPATNGECVVIRILDKESIAGDRQALTLELLGFSERERVRFRRCIREPYGMILVTGPTGSGKTTTLYAALSEINAEEEKVVTIEDPVEYQVKGVVQIPVNEKKGLTFARGLRSILRHDPDKIMVGEIRDPETAQIAVQSALTGHLVFTTVHANNAFDVLGRFLHMGIDAYNFVSCLNCVLVQRLVRLICPECRYPLTYDRQTLENGSLSFEQYGGVTFYEGRGCSECNGIGYRGRKAIVELLVMNDHIRELIIAKRPISELKRAARDSGAILLREAAIAQVLEGVTTLSEINRVTFAEVE